MVTPAEREFLRFMNARNGDRDRKALLRLMAAWDRGMYGWKYPFVVLREVITGKVQWERET